MDSSPDDAPSFAAAEAAENKKKKRRGQGCQSQTVKNWERNKVESRRVSRINEQYDSLVVMLGGVVSWSGDKRAWWRGGKEGKLRKLDILEAAASYLRRLMEEMEEVNSKKGIEVIYYPARMRKA